MRWRGTKAELLAALNKLPGVLSNAEPDPYGLSIVFMAEVGAAALRCVYDDFRAKSDGGTGRDGVKWADLAESTLERRRAKGIVHDAILRETEALRQSLEPGSMAPGQVFRLEQGSVTVGSEIPYADHHQNGTPRMPARPIVPVDGAIPPGWEAELQEGAARGMEKVLELVCYYGGVG